MPSISTKGSPSMIMRSAIGAASRPRRRCRRCTSASAAVSSDGPPLDAGREARAAAAAQARLGDLFDGRRGAEAHAPAPARASRHGRDSRPATSGSMMPQRAKVRRVCLLRKGISSGSPDAQRMATPPAGRRRTGPPRPSTATGPKPMRPLGSLDLDQRLQPEQAARAGAHDLDGDALALGSLRQSPPRPCRRRRRGPRHRGERRCASLIARPRARCRRSSPWLSRPITSPSSIADGRRGAEAQAIRSPRW